MYKKISIKAILIFCAILAHAQDWIIYNPFNMPEPSLLKNIYCVDVNTAYVVGYNLIAYKTSNGGDHWEKLNTNTATDFAWDLHDVAFVNTKIGFAVGENGTIIRTIDGGDNWVLLDSKTTSDLHAIYFVDSSTGYVVGNDGIILKTENKGDLWTKQISWGSTNFKSISFLDTDTGYISGEKGNIMKTTNGGDLWLSLNINSSQSFTGINFINSKIGYVNSLTKLFKTTDGGQNWISIDFGLNNKWIADICFTDSIMGYVLDDWGNVFKTTDGGANWTQQFLGEDGNTQFTAISYIDNNTGFIVGYTYGKGLVYKTQDAGISWVNKTYLCAMANCISFPDENNGYIISIDGKMLKTVDRGVTWNCLQSGITNTRIMDMIFLDINTGYAVGNEIYKTIDGGQNWSIQNQLVASYSHWICFPAKDIGYAGGSRGIILKKESGQTDWVPQYYQEDLTLYSAFFTDQNTGYTVGTCSRYKSILLKTIDGGNTWNEIGQDITYPVKEVYFTDSQTGYVAGDNGVIYKTTNAGQSWVRLTSEYDYQFVISSMCFSDANTGYIIGYDDILFNSPIAKNYKTTNAGDTWTTYKSNIEDPILKSMIFTNSNSGHAISNNGVILRTNNIIASTENFDLSCKNVKIYPNPANDLLNIKLLNSIGFTKLIIYNISGTKLIDRQATSDITQINIDFLPNGIYILKVIVGNDVITKEFVKY